MLPDDVAMSRLACLVAVFPLTPQLPAHIDVSGTNVVYLNVGGSAGSGNGVFSFEFAAGHSLALESVYAGRCVSLDEL